MGLRLIALAAVVAATWAGAAQAQVVTDVENGDTLVVDGIGKVRLLGIKHADPSAFSLGGNTAPSARTGPETAPPNAVGGSIGFGRDRPARDLLRELVLGKIVRLERDSLTDDRGRVYVFVDDLLVNAEMVRLGRARVDTSRRFARQPEFARLQKDAQEQGVGIWTSTRP